MLPTMMNINLVVIAITMVVIVKDFGVGLNVSTLDGMEKYAAARAKGAMILTRVSI